MRTITVKELSEKTLEALRAEGYKESSIYCARKIQKQLIRAHEAAGKIEFDPETLETYRVGLKKKFEAGGYTRNRYNFLLRQALYMEQYWQTGAVDTTPRREYPDVPECFKKQFFDEYAATVSPRHHTKYAWRVRPHLIWLFKNGYTDITKVDENVIRAYMLDCSNRVCANTVNNERMFLKGFYRYLYAKKLTSSDFAMLFSFPVATESKILKPIPQDEIAATFKSIDRSTPEGKRRYAMFMLSSITGLRSIDIIKLQRKDIDWEKGEIRLTQSKTSRALALPLTKDVGEAIQDYLLNARPDCKFDTVFLTKRAPFKPYAKSVSVGNIHNSQRKIAGLPKAKNHGLRRTLAKNMISAGVPATDVAQVLGDKKLDSVTPYISVDTENLAECSLGFDDIPLVTKPKSQFISGFADDIDAYFEYRTAMGFKKKPYLHTLRMFDAFCAEKYPEQSDLTKEIVLTWWADFSLKLVNSAKVKAGAIRMFAKYLNGMGKSAYILPTNMVAKYIRFTPYMLSDDELKSLFYQFDVFNRPKNFKPFTESVAPIMFRLMYTCGLRPQEARMVRRCNINLDNGEILITNTKRHKERIVVMSPEMLDICRAYEVKRLLFDKDGDWFFPRKPGEPYTPSQVESIFGYCWRQANPDLTKEQLPRLRPYDLRHRFASAVLHKWLDEGKDLYAMLPYLRAHMGHKKLDDTAYYIHILPENLLKSRGVNWDAMEINVEVTAWED